MKTEDIKKFYNDTLKGGLAVSYEFNRWHKNDERESGFEMTQYVIENFLLSNEKSFKRCIEIGPGPGTWTQFFVKKFTSASFDLVDISKEMLVATKERFAGFNNISFIESDFLHFVDKGYDFLFSSRAFEYFPDKLELVKKIGMVLNESGEGFVITKAPHIVRQKIFRRNSVVHSGQIGPVQFKNLFEKNGFIVTRVVPVTFVFPFLHSGYFNRLLFKMFKRFKLNFLTYFFCESYAIFFKKNNN